MYLSQIAGVIHTLSNSGDINMDHEEMTAHIDAEAASGDVTIE
ncbi:hypothetical protein JOC77_003135 [Peribacillus deserti]|uniref:Uncharacterized protein n=1 Tax=Peribacillus deserti TaxID=673318 RepID=A0ABS2QKI9_9BACI|nr:hypothetical protein [Peribacillus deserti]MBM7693691.1 hypothetical protein [Peribacillus deserti]